MRPTLFAIATLAATAMGNYAGTTSARSEGSAEVVQSRAVGEPILAIVSLKDQRITLYDAHGWILRAPVSSGQKGRETPAGIFSVIQKEAEHYSNLYDDAYMPNMQRMTWSGIALHGGPLPGYPASHGCIRLPFDFAARLFDVTPLGLRVIVTPADAAPMEIAHPALLQSKPDAWALALATVRKAEAEQAARKAEQAKLAAGTTLREATEAMASVRTVEGLRLKAQAHLASALSELGSARSPEAKQQAEDARAKAVARLAEVEVQLADAKTQLQAKVNSVKPAREAAVVAETAQAAAGETARQAARLLEPVSVLISRSTQRLYVRQAFEPIFESPVTILDSDRPIGTHVFTAMEQTSGDTHLRWSVVSFKGGHLHDGTVEPRDLEPKLAEPDGAKAALDRIVIPQDVVDRMPGVVPRSSLIVTDEALSSETGKGTDFVVLLSGEPQGGIKFRRRGLGTEVGSARPRDRPSDGQLPFGGPLSTW